MPQTIPIDGFGGGINARVPAVDIRDNEVVDALNMELDGNRTLVTRPGLTSVSGSEDFATGAGAAQDVLGLFHFKTSDGTVDQVIACTSDGIHKASPGSSTWSEITPSGGLTTATRWEFAVLNDLLILSNMKDPLQVWNGTGLVAEMSYVSSTDPGDPLSIAVMDNRLFMVDKAAPNTVKWSKLGDPQDFNTTGAAGTGSWEVGGAEGEGINRAYNHRGRLFFFKPNSIYTLVPGGPREDTAQWSVPDLVKGVGLAAPDSVQVIRDEVIFLSDTGVLSLSATAKYGDWNQAEMSINIPLLREWQKQQGEKVRSVVHPSKKQYLLSVPQESGATNNTVTWVLDYTEGAAWTRYDAVMAAKAFASVKVSGVPTLYVGKTLVYKEDASVWQDNAVSYTKLIQTKSYSLGETMKRKLWHRFGVQFEALTDPLTVEILYRLDQDSLKAKTINYSFAGLLTGAYWDEDLWDVGYWSSELTDLTDLIYRIQGGPGRRGQLIDFRFRNAANEAFGLKRMSLDVTLLDTHKHVSE
ncbi:MAG: hypothetical protein ACYS7Y_28620 [Planctomycetota bacterium]|jgi:hypothetical protein